MSDGEDKFLSDVELDRLLAHASRPEPKPGFEARLALRIAGHETAFAGSNVVAFRPQQVKLQASRRPALRWPFAAAMAASLVVGLWLGGTGQLSNLFDQASETAALETASGFLPAGLEELGNAEVDNLS